MAKRQVVRHGDGRKIGEIVIADSLSRLYDEGRHPDYLWPEGIARALSALTPAQMTALGVDPETVIHLE